MPFFSLFFNGASLRVETPRGCSAFYLPDYSGSSASSLADCRGSRGLLHGLVSRYAEWVS